MSTTPYTNVIATDGRPIKSNGAKKPTNSFSQTTHGGCLSNNQSPVFGDHRNQPVPVIQALARLRDQRKLARKPYVKEAEAESGLSAWQIRTLLKLEPLAALFMGVPINGQPTLKQLNVLKMAPRNYAVDAWESMQADQAALPPEEATPSKTTLILKRWAIQVRTAQSGSTIAHEVLDQFDALDSALQASGKAETVRDSLQRVKIRALLLLT